MFDLKQMLTNETAEVEGVWIDFEGGLRLKIARVNNENHEQYMLDKRRDIQAKRRLGNADEISREEIKTLTIDSMAKHILVDWENMRENGTTIPYSVDEARRVLTKYKEFYKLVEEEAMSVANFRDEVTEGELGNSEGSETGTGDGDTRSLNSEPSSD